MSLESSSFCFFLRPRLNFLLFSRSSIDLSVFVDGSWYLSPSAAHHQSVYAAQQLAAGGGGSRLPSGNNGSTSSSSPVGRVSSASSASGGNSHHHASHRVVPYSVPSSGHKSPTSAPGKFKIHLFLYFTIDFICGADVVMLICSAMKTGQESRGRCRPVSLCVLNFVFFFSFFWKKKRTESDKLVERARGNSNQGFPSMRVV